MTFITLEGVDGCGKTTQIQRLSAYLRTQGIDHCVTREPGGTAAGEQMRSVFLQDATLSATTQALAMYAQRHHHIQQVIRPALAKKQWVLCDRFDDSTQVYQGYIGGVSKHLLNTLKQEVLGSLRPTLTFVFTLPPKVAWQRRNGPNTQHTADAFDHQSVATYQRIAQGFQHIMDQGHWYREIAADQSEDKVFQSIVTTLHRDALL